MGTERSGRRNQWAAPALAAGILAMAIGAAFLTPGAAAKGGLQGNCPIGKGEPSLPCSASEGQQYGGYDIPDDAEDTEVSLEAVLGYVKDEPTDVTPVAQALQGGDSGEFEIIFQKADPGPGVESFRWEYSGEAPLAFATVWSDEGGFAIYDVFNETEGIINFAAELGEAANVNHVSFWQRTSADCEPVRVEDAHGKGMLPNWQLAEIVNGKVMCVSLKSEKLKKCKFNTGAKPSGKWLEGIQGGEHADYALGSQQISRKGKRGGTWLVASKMIEGAAIPCRKPTAAEERAGRRAERRDAPIPTSDTPLPSSFVEETPGATTNKRQLLVNYATRDVCNNSPLHPDGAVQTSHPSASVWCFSRTGAGLNDPNGTERTAPSSGGDYYQTVAHRHGILYNNSLVAAAKRPNTKPDGTILLNTPIAWRMVAPKAKLAN